MALRITVENVETGEKGAALVPDGSYILITDGDAYLASTQTYRHTHVLTVRGLKDGIPVLDTEPRRASAPAEGGDGS